MNMNTAEQTLVIFLSTFLALFLLFSIILIIKLIQIVDRLRGISDKALEVAGNVEAASEMLRKTAGPIAVGRFFMNILDVVTKHKGGK